VSDLTKFIMGGCVDAISDQATIYDGLTAPPMTNCLDWTSKSPRIFECNMDATSTCKDPNLVSIANQTYPVASTPNQQVFTFNIEFTPTFPDYGCNYGLTTTGQGFLYQDEMKGWIHWGYATLTCQGGTVPNLNPLAIISSVSLSVFVFANSSDV